MAIELARTVALPRPWGVADPGPWSKQGKDGKPIGEVWYERPGKPTANPSLLLKLLFTSQPLSIQVHPDDDYARSIGLPNGKTEAWYVLSAAPGAKVAVGLNRQLTEQQLRGALTDGSIVDFVVWQAVSPDDVIYVPAGTIHAIGAGLVIAEIQQRSDATFRLFDYGRQRELHIESAIAVADVSRAHFQIRPNRLTDERTLLVSGPHFVLERIELAPHSTWCLEAKRETWLLVVNGNGTAGSFDIAAADAVFAQSDHVDIRAGTTGMVILAAYTGVGSVPHLLRRLREPGSTDGRQSQEILAAPSLLRASPVLPGEHMEIAR
jgi:mannose-6-phosphate isomerase